MRSIYFALALLVSPALAAAQQTPHVRPGEPWSVARPAEQTWTALGSIGLPLPSIGLPLPSIGLSPDPRVDPVNPAYTRQQRGPHNPVRHQPSLWPSYVYIAQPYPWTGMPSAQVVTQSTAVPGVITVVPQPLNGRLRLDVQPAEVLQVFVDGVYVGTPADLGHELDLPPGSRRIEFRAPGHKTLVIDAQIVAERTIVYRAALERVAPSPAPVPAPTPAPAPAPPAVPIGKRTMYMIPGCYLGNVPPQEVKLPASCDLSKLTTITP